MDAAPGTVVSLNDSGMTVAGNGGSILVSRIRTEEGAKLAAGEIAEQSGISVSAVLGKD